MTKVLIYIFTIQNNYIYFIYNYKTILFIFKFFIIILRFFNIKEKLFITFYLETNDLTKKQNRIIDTYFEDND